MIAREEARQKWNEFLVLIEQENLALKHVVNQIEKVMRGKEVIAQIKERYSMNHQALGDMDTDNQELWKGDIARKFAFMHTETWKKSYYYYQGLDALADDLVNAGLALSHRKDTIEGNVSEYSLMRDYYQGVYERNTN